MADAAAAPYRMCLFHLAVLVSMPAFAPAYLRAMRSASIRSMRSAGQWIGDLEQAFRAEHPALFDKKDEAHWWRLYGCLQAIAGQGLWGSVQMHEFASWAPRVARFTFTPE